MKGRLVLSVVSHGQGGMVSDLLSDLNKLDYSMFEDVTIVVTLNIPEDESFVAVCNLRIHIVRNLRPLGFGGNHNQAFAMMKSDYFLVLNPDLRIPVFNFNLLLDESNGCWGGVAPVVLSPDGVVEDSVRRYPTALRIIKRVVFRLRSPDYFIGDAEGMSQKVDWVAGMFILFKSRVFTAVRGFDDRYFMYLEDADICQRVNDSGECIKYSAVQSVIHDARRNSFKSLKHMKWHVRSLIRFLLGV